MWLWGRISTTQVPISESETVVRHLGKHMWYSHEYQINSL